MTRQFDNAAIKGWQEQLGIALRVVEAITEGAMKMRESQITAATETHATAVATRKLLEKASDPQELLRIQSQWLTGSFAKSLAYWQALHTAALETQSSIVKCISEGAQVVGPSAPAAAQQAQSVGEAPLWPLQEMMDSLYRPWVEKTRELFIPPLVSTAQARKEKRPQRTLEP